MLRLSARWALPIDAAPIARAAVLVDPSGRIGMVGPEDLVPRPAEARTLDLGDAILLPGLVNTHTHLELTGFETADSGTGFPAWIRRIRALKEARSRDAFRFAARQGLRDCWAAGVTTIAETGDTGAAFDALLEMGGSGVVYQEVFGPHPDQAADSAAELERTVASLRSRAGGRVTVGVSPHAPYTVSAPLYRAVVAWARNEGLALAVHLAESDAETQLVTRGAGPFAEAWRARGIPVEFGGYRSPVDYLDALGVLGPDTLCIHAVQVDAEDIRILAERGVAVAHCPISNRVHGHGRAPLPAMREAGLRIGAGTDSVVSVGSLDLLAEARAARELGALTAAQALDLVTLGAARSLGLEREIGTITPGKWADLVALLPEPGPAGPEEQALSAGPHDAVLTVCGGRIVHEAALVRDRP